MIFNDLKKCLRKNPNLSYDEACVDIINTLNESATIYYQYNECHYCEPQKLLTVDASTNTSVVAKTSSTIELYCTIKNNTNKDRLCIFEKLLYEHYHYVWNISEKCSFYIKEPADNAYLPILKAFVLLFCFGTLWYMVKCIYKHSGRVRRFLVWNSEIEEDLGGSSSCTPLVIERAPPLRKHSHRIKSIDVFRGLCIMLMIFVNYGGGEYWFFKHSVWNGITIADLVFPWFLWIMGLSLTVSIRNKLRRAVPRRQMVFQIIRRCVILLLLGIMINSNHNMSTISDLRYPGVLQRIAVTYLIVGILEVAFTERTEIETMSQFHDVISAWPQWFTVMLLVFVHTSVTFLVEVPGCGKGYLGPGGLANHGKFFNCTGGIAGSIDRSIFGNHMYKHPACQRVYENIVYYDPEGILGTCTSILTVYFGVQAGRTLNTYHHVRSKIIRWTTWGFITGLIGGGLCCFTRDSGPIPLNKQLWSLSFVLTTSGMAFIIQACLFLMVDILRKWGGRPFFYPGMNAIVLYVGHEFMKDTFPFAWKPTQKTHGTYLLMNLWGTFLWVSVSIFLYKRNIFLTI